MRKIAHTISLDEIKAAVTELTNDKMPGLNKVPLNSFKALKDDNLTHLLDFFNNYWLEKNFFDEWHEGQIVPVPKSGDLSDPKKWCGVTLMYTGENS